ncbi:MAG: LacI family transcriptional regulator [Chloroflexi bacterium]|nr:LacI family transcriptional regulator [Chloroflexota bacterium]MCI0575056.1 LacI family transcriptional regulator [Chloroflexota bacterium]MCI0643582.1 LacI family transcriptional regulator [Chloroflexota bacterium]MCI0726204.1 LacI family transcriptional regulator [Chloroflexota bacterium]
MTRKRITGAAVAKEAGVSRTTVSLVLNNIPNASIPAETRRKVMDAAARLKYYPHAGARRLASGRTWTLAFVMHQSPERATSDLFLPQVLHGLNTVARQYGYYILFWPVDPADPQEDYSHLIYEGHVDGIILSGPLLDEPEAVALDEQGLTIVLTGRLPGRTLPCVDVDNYLGARQATDHLIGLGHRRVALIANAPRTYLSSYERHRGYQASLLAAGLPYDEALVQEGDFTGRSGYRAMNALLDLAEPPTAVFIASDVVAFGAIQAVKNRGLSIPRDVAIVGFDDVAIAQYVEPHLTTVHLPAYDLGWQVGQLALQLLNKEPAGNLVKLLATHLVIRDSCGARLS